MFRLNIYLLFSHITIKNLGAWQFTTLLPNSSVLHEVFCVTPIVELRLSGPQLSIGLLITEARLHIGMLPIPGGLHSNPGKGDNY